MDSEALEFTPPIFQERTEPRLSGRSRMLSVLGAALLVVALLLVLSQTRGGQARADGETGVPARPNGLSASTTPGSLEVVVDWDDTSGATHYKVRWRVAGFGNALNEGVEAQSSYASITVADYGEWVVRVEACNSVGCGPGSARRFAVSPAPTATPTPTVTPTPAIRIPAPPSLLQVETQPGSLDVSVDWNDASGASYYKVYWRVAGFGNSLNEGVEAQSSDAGITVADHGEWVVRVEACNSAGCGPGAARRFAVNPVPTATATPTPTTTPTATSAPTATATPTPTATATATATPTSTVTPTPESGERTYRGELGRAFVELSLRRPAKEAAGESAARTSRQTRQSETATATSTTTSIVYVVDDSLTLDGDFHEVRRALQDVRDTQMADTKVALFKFGSNSTKLFGLTDHSSAPWNDHIDSFSGTQGVYTNWTVLSSAKRLLDGDSADFKKVIFMTDALSINLHQDLDGTIDSLAEAGIVADTIGLGIHSLVGFESLESIATGTGGEARMVWKPINGTTNDPAVTARDMSDILKDSVADNTATLFLFDTSISIFLVGLGDDPRKEALIAAATKAGTSTDAQVGMAKFSGESVKKYELVNAIGSSSLSDPSSGKLQAGTNIDYALREAYKTISDEDVTATNKRVVLISDGITVEVRDSALDLYSYNGVILDVVAFRSHADRVLLKNLADATGGNFNVAQLMSEWVWEPEEEE